MTSQDYTFLLYAGFVLIGHFMYKKYKYLNNRDSYIEVEFVCKKCGKIQEEVNFDPNDNKYKFTCECGEKNEINKEKVEIKN